VFYGSPNGRSVMLKHASFTPIRPRRRSAAHKHAGLTERRSGAPFEARPAHRVLVVGLEG